MSQTRTAARRVVFAGGAQIRLLARVYRAQHSNRPDVDVAVIGANPGPAQRAQLAEAELVVLELTDAETPTPDLPADAELVRVPVLLADFLWPYAGRPHPRNRGQFPMPGGPYPADHGDRFLDRMIEQGVGEPEAIARYLALDIAAAAELDRKLEHRLQTAKRLDRETGFAMAPLIEERFRSSELFAARSRPLRPLLQGLAEQLAARIGLPAPGRDALRPLDAPASAQPLHPGVIAHFGLSYARPDATYPMIDEGSFTFEEYCRRYMRFTWNETLQRGLRDARSNPRAALADLEAGMEISPDSARGRRVLDIARKAAGGAQKPPGGAATRPAADPPAANGAAPIPPAPESEPDFAAPAPELAESESVARLAEETGPALPFVVPPEPASAPPRKRSLFSRLIGG